MADTAKDPGDSSLRFMLRALRYPNYRLFFGGQLISLVGTWLSSVASSWLVYRLASTQSPGRAALMLGLVGFAGQIPIFILSPLTGVLVDRWNRHRILLATQTLSMIQSLALAALALSGRITIPQILGLSVFQGIVNAFDVTARQTFVVEIIEHRDDLSGAIALNSSMFHMARLIGPAVAGWLIYVSSEGICFLIDGISYLAVIVALALMRFKPRVESRRHSHPWHALREGIRYSFGFPPIRTLLIMVGVTSLLGMSQAVLMPIFARKVLGGDERIFGLLMGASGVGALVGSLYLASRRSVLGLGRVMAVAAGVLGLGMIAFSASRSLVLSLALLPFVGGALVVEIASANTILQTIIEDDKRGRVMSLFAMAVLGMAPFGSLLAGAAADAIGAPWSLAVAGGVCLFSGVVFALQLSALRPLIRPIYIRKGILPEMAEGIRSASTLASTPPD